MSSLSKSQATTSQRTVVVDTSRSPFARLRPLSLSDVRIYDAFWTPRLEINRTATIPFEYEQCESTGRLDNFRRVIGRYEGPFQGRYFNDSDVYKWLEAASWSLATHPDPALEAQVDKTIELIAAAQDKDGYLDTYFTFERVPERWTNLPVLHELYCAGHLIQAAVAHHRATSSDSLLTVATKLADHIVATFGPTAHSGACGHPEVEMALVELARDTGDERYLREAQFFIEQRGHHLPSMDGKAYDQDHAPIREQHEVVGHAVRALYLYSGVTDVSAEMGEQALEQALETLWDNFTERKVYITGGAGARYEGEAFGVDYELPNDRAYAETCAAIASVMWNWRLLLLKGEARFADMIETTLYNSVLSGVSLDGEVFFYQNPLADNGQHRRQPWFTTACCPPNIARLFASLPGYLYSTSDAGIWTHLYIASTATTMLPNGQSITLEQQTNYPWDGEVELSVQIDAPSSFSLFLRVPAWAAGARMTINSEEFTQPIEPGSYVEIRREWQSGDVVHLSLPMEVRMLVSNSHVAPDYSRVAMMRGPLVYCAEQVDNPGVDLANVVLPAQPAWETVERPDLLGGIRTIQTRALLTNPQPPDEASLYRSYNAARPTYTSTSLTAIPYYAWANREAGAMQVWLPIDRYA
ncbi:MAG: glycoside hydrolase family 127 protein [Ktedonobacteraceae bacterium]|nr:glycoside hydrolase family 127 protein [Ktedonobacteraceae bacterium]